MEPDLLHQVSHPVAHLDPGGLEVVPDRLGNDLADTHAGVELGSC